MTHALLHRTGTAAIGVSFIAASLLGITGPVEAASVANGTVVHLSNQGKQYLVENGKLHWIPNAPTFIALGLSWNRTVAVTSLPLPTGAPVALVKMADSPAVYVEQGRMLHEIPSAADFEASGYQWRDVFTVSSLPLPIGTPAVAPPWPNGTVVHLANQGKQYLVENGKLHWIPNAPTFLALGLSWNKAIPVTSLPLPVGTPVSLVKVADSPAVYLEQGGFLHKIPSASEFEALGYHWRNVFTMSSLPLPVGAPLGKSGVTPAFAGHNVQHDIGTETPQALPNGFQAPKDQHMTFSDHTDHRLEGFTGTLNGHPFILDFYEDYPVGDVVGVSYNSRPVYFGNGPAAVFDVLNFTGNTVVLGSPTVGAYMALNLVTGQSMVNPSQVVPLKGYQGLTAPSHILGLPGTHYPVGVPYASSN